MISRAPQTAQRVTRSVSRAEICCVRIACLPQFWTSPQQSSIDVHRHGLGSLRLDARLFDAPSRFRWPDLLLQRAGKFLRVGHTALATSFCARTAPLGHNLARSRVSVPGRFSTRLAASTGISRSRYLRTCASCASTLVISLARVRSEAQRRPGAVPVRSRNARENPRTAARAAA